MPTPPLLRGSRREPAPPPLQSAACHARRARHLVRRSSLATIHFVGHLVGYRFIHGPFVCFFLFLSFILDSSLLSRAFTLASFAIRLRPSPFLPLPTSRLYITFNRCFHSEHRTLLSHTTPRGMSPAGHSPSTPFSFPSLFPLPAYRTLYHHGLVLDV